MQCFVCETPFREGAQPAEAWTDGDRILAVCHACAQPTLPTLPSDLQKALDDAETPAQARSAACLVRSYRVKAAAVGAMVRAHCIIERSRALHELSIELHERSQVVLGMLAEHKEERKRVRRESVVV